MPLVRFELGSLEWQAELVTVIPLHSLIVLNFLQFNAQADEGLNIFDTAQHGFSLFKILNKTR